MPDHYYCLECDQEVKKDEDIDRVFKSDEYEWRCTILSTYCPYCNIVTIKLYDGDGESIANQDKKAI